MENEFNIIWNFLQTKFNYKSGDKIDFIDFDDACNIAKFNINTLDELEKFEKFTNCQIVAYI